MLPLLPSDPEQMGGYHLVARLGAGGMGIVYLATKGVNRVALKVLNPALISEASQRERFAREAEAMARIDSPRVARLVDWHVSDQEAWLAMEFVNGPNLRDLVHQDGPLPEPYWLALAKGLADGISEFHSKGIVHRDLKPGNIVLSPSGPVVIDFGISMTMDATRITRTGTVEGSPAWLSPEQLEQEIVGPESDVFSLGSVLVFAARGASPWGREDTMTVPVVFSRILSEPPNLEGLSGEQTALVEEMLEKDPSKRISASAASTSLSDVDLRVFENGEWQRLRKQISTPGRASGDEYTTTSVINRSIPKDDLETTEVLSSAPHPQPRVGPEPSGPPKSNNLQISKVKKTTRSKILFSGGLTTVAIGILTALTSLLVASPQVQSSQPTITLIWSQGDAYSGAETVDGNTGYVPSKLLEDFYSVTHESITRKACVPRNEVEAYIGSGQLPSFQVLDDNGNWIDLVYAELGSELCSDSLQSVTVILSKDFLETWVPADSCRDFRYFEPGTLTGSSTSINSRYEQWCVSYNPESPA